MNSSPRQFLPPCARPSASHRPQDIGAPATGAKASSSPGSIRSTPKSAKSGSRTSGGSPQKRTNSAAPRPSQMRNHHSIDGTRGSRSGRVQIGIAIHVTSCRHCENSGARPQPWPARQNNRRLKSMGSAPDLTACSTRGFSASSAAITPARFLRAGTFFVRLVKLGRVVAEVVHIVAGRLQPIDQSGGAQSLRAPSRPGALRLRLSARQAAQSYSAGGQF